MLGNVGGVSPSFKFIRLPSTLLLKLKGFETVELVPGESQKISFQIDSSLLEFYSYNNKWEAEVGKFHVFIGGDSNVSEYKEFYLTD